MTNTNYRKAPTKTAPAQIVTTKGNSNSEESGNYSFTLAATGNDNGSDNGDDNDNGNDTSGTGQSGTEWDGTGRDGTEWDGAGRSTLSSGLIEYINHPIIKLKEWYNNRMSKLYWATGNKMIEKYLSAHEENPLQKYFGDRYGRWITGWDSEKGEPIITYSCFHLPPQMMSDGADVIPFDYWDEEDLPEDMIMSHVSNDEVDDDDLPW